MTDKVSEPTIDQMLVYFDAVARDHGWQTSYYKAIRSILEQVRASEYLTGTIAEWLVEKRRIELEAIQRFVERVETKRWELVATSPNPYAEALYAELAAMEGTE